MQQHDLVIRGHLGDVGLVVATPQLHCQVDSLLVSGGRYGGYAMKRTSTDGMLTIRGEKKTERDEGQGQELACRAQLRLGQREAAMFACSSFARVVLRNVKVHYVHILNC